MPDLPSGPISPIDPDIESKSPKIFMLEHHAQRPEVTQRSRGMMAPVIVGGLFLLYFSVAGRFPIFRTILLVIFLLYLVYIIIAQFTNLVSESMHFILRQRLFAPFHYFILKNRYHVISHKTLRQKTFAQYNEVNQPFFILLLKYLAKHPSYLNQLGPTAQQLILRYKEAKYEVNALNDVFDYYTYSTEELLHHYLTHRTISSDFRERIIFEADMTDRHLLDRELPATDLLLKEIYEHDHIGLTSGFGILK